MSVYYKGLYREEKAAQPRGFFEIHYYEQTEFPQGHTGINRYRLLVEMVDLWRFSSCNTCDMSTALADQQAASLVEVYLYFERSQP
jgi:hypothetical protein